MFSLPGMQVSIVEFEVYILLLSLLLLKHLRYGVLQSILL